MANSGDAGLGAHAQEPRALPATPAASGADVSPRTVLALVLLALAVSFIGGFITLAQVLTPHGEAAPAALHPMSAQVGFVIEEVPRISDSTVGEVTLVIERPPG